MGGKKEGDVTIKLDVLLAKNGLNQAELQQKACKTSPQRFEIVQEFMLGKQAKTIAAEMGVTRCRVLQQLHYAIRDMSTERQADLHGKRIRHVFVTTPMDSTACT